MPIRLFALPALAAITVLLVSSAPAGAASAHGAKLAPPVIHESFAPLPCTGAPGQRTTLQMEGCAEQQILASDKQIDSLNRSIFGKLFDNAARRRFIAGHNAWLTYRHTYCLSASDVFEGGTEAGVVFADCVAAVNTQHVKDLKGFLADFG
ncbi:MAG TPA: lysozyme inhibitor LprI family protein [Solirubrobacteraceae bacterium]|nr:lysozyme inhibitor LprI family protein [Solirubrobacteraceae bacterium]